MHFGPAQWNGRDAFQAGNGIIELTQLVCGGHIAEFRFAAGSGFSRANPLWTPRWKSIDPVDYDAAAQEAIYGPRVAGKTLCGLAGHSLCLDLFGTPSPEEVRCGATVHGEAGVSPWEFTQDRAGRLRSSVRLPAAGLRFERVVSLFDGESVVRINETIGNLRAIDQCFQWQQHVTLGAPFLSREQCVISLPGTRGITLAAGYEGHELLASGAEFDWPSAPGHDGGRCDLRAPLQQEGRGFVAGIEIDPRRRHGFVCAVNAACGLLIGYVFRRVDFPWVALWEEYRARAYPPWNGVEQTRGVEFGASPLPLTRRDNVMAGPLFGTPTLASVPAKSRITAGYAAFIAVPPPAAREVTDVLVEADGLRLRYASGIPDQLLSARDIGQFLISA